MSSLTLLSNLMLVFVLMISGIILLFIKTIPHPRDKPYRMVKRRIAYMWLVSGVSIIIALTVGKFSNIICTVILGMTIISALISVVQHFKVRKEHEKPLENLIVDNEMKCTQWIGKMFYSLIPVTIFVTFSYIINSTYYNLVYDVMLIFIVIFYTIKIINYQYMFHVTQSVAKSSDSRQAESSNSSEDDIPKEQRDQKLIQSENKLRMIHESIEKWINDEEKAYLKTGLTIQEVSLMTGIPKRKLSDFIHLHYNLSFNSWINILRVQEVERILSNKESSTMTLSEISYKTGFSDLSNMSSTFKKIKGMNPSEYRMLISQ